MPTVSATGMTMSEPEAARAWESADGFAWSSEDWFPAAGFWLSLVWPGLLGSTGGFGLSCPPELSGLSGLAGLAW